MHHIYVERQGVWEESIGNDENLISATSFVLAVGSKQAVAKWSDGFWDVWARIPSDLEHPLGPANVGKYLGMVRPKEAFPAYWESYPSINSGADVATKSSPYGGGSLGGAVTELLRLA